MPKEMKVIMESWNKFVLFENQTLEKIKNSDAETKNLIQQISKIKDKEKLQNFLSIVSQDEEIMDLVSSFREMKEIIESESVDEGIVDDFMDKQLKVQTDALIAAQNFFNTELGKKIKTYGPAAAAIAWMAYSISSSGTVDPMMAPDAIELILKGKKLQAADVFGMISGVDAAGNVMERANA
jgi:hypothetical protein